MARTDAVVARGTLGPHGAPTPRVGGRRPHVTSDLLAGDHLCCIYETEAEQRAALVPYLRTGLERGEKLLYIVDARTAGAVLRDLRNDGVDVDAHLADGSLAVLSRKETYVRDGTFDPATMISMLREATELAVAEGYPALRVTGEMTWALRGLPGSERLIEYESRLNDFFPGSRCLALCQYDRRRFQPAVLLDVLRTHPHVAIGAQIVQNPYYLPPTEFLGVDRPSSDLDQWMRNLVDRRREEDELRAARERSEAIIAAMRDGFAVADAAGVILSVNPALCAMTGFSADELVGVRPPHPYWPPEDVAIIGAALARTAQGESAEFEHTFRRKNGERFPVVVSPSVIRDKDGQTVAVFASMRDDTERARTLQALREGEERFRLTFHHGPFGAAIVGRDQRFQLVNEAFARMTGYTPEELATLSFNQVTHPDDSAADAAAIPRLGTGEIERYERDKRYVRKDGSVAWGHVVVRPLHDAEGRPFAFLAMIDDITERKRTEEALQLTRRMLDEAQAISKLGGWEYDVAEGRMAWTDEVYRIYGVDREFDPGDVNRDIGFYAPDSAPLVRQAFRRALESGEPYDLEVQFDRADGERIWIRTIGRPVVEDGTVVRVIGDIMDITERKQAEQALRESEGRLRAVLETMSLISVILDSRGRITFCNDFLLDLTGWMRDEVLGKSWFDVFLPADIREAVRSEVFLSAIATGDMPLHFENEIVTRQGERRLVVWNNTVLSDAAGQVESVASIGEDITDSRRAEAALRESEERLRFVLKGSNDGWWDRDMRGERAYFSPRWWDMLGYAEGELPADSGLRRRLTHPDDVERVDRVLAAAHESGQASYEVEFRLRHKDGHWVPVLSRGFLLRDETGTPVRVSGVNTDLTERKRAEEETALTLSLLESTMESTADGLLVADGKGGMVLSNAKFREIWGIPEAIIASKDDDAALSFVLDQLKEPEVFLKTVRDLYGAPEETSFDVLEMRDGRVLERYSQPQRIGASVVGRVWSFRDVTKRKQAEAQVLQSQKMETVGRLAGGVAHDFNNLLAVVIGNAELARAGLDAADPRSVAIAEVEDAARRGVALTRQLLAFSQQQVASPEVLDINAVVGEMERMLRRIIGEAIALTFIEGEPAGRVRADHAQIGQVLMNLAVNARDAMPLGGTLVIETQTAVLDAVDARRPPSLAPGRYVMVTLADTGTGMAGEARTRLFEPFFTTKGPAEGSGLGLSTAQGIARQSGGDLVLVESEPGRGSTFTLYLPAVDDPVPAPRSASAEPAAAGTETILLVEDDAGVRRLAQRILLDAGYTVLTAGDGVEALAVLAAHPGTVDLVVSDVIMPTMGGAELARRVAETHPDTAILLTSGYPGDIPAGEGELPAGAHFIGKPYAAAELTAKVRAVLGG